MNFAGNIETFLTGVYTVTRRAPPTVGSDGVLDEASPTTLTIRGSCFPAGGKNLERNPEGLRAGERRTLYTTTELRVLGAPDVVSIDGALWEVEMASDYHQLGNFYEYTILRFGDGL